MTALLRTETARPEDAFQDFFRSYQTDEVGSKYRKRLAQVAVNNGRSLVVDFEDLIAFDPALARSVVEHPDEFIKHASSAATAQMRVEDPEYEGQVFARFRRLPEKTSLRKVGAENLKKLALVEGIVVRSSQVKPTIVQAVFRCRRCAEVIREEQSGELMRGPGSACPSCKQRGPFELLEEESKFRNTQDARVQERPEDLPPGQLPRYLDVRLEDDLVDTARPGDRVALTSIVRAEKQFVGEKGRLRTFNLYLEANHIDVVGKETEIVEITAEDEKRILEASQDPWIDRKLILSIAPSIYGYEDIKEAIMYLLLGGVAKQLPDGMNIRGDSHTLIIGDPGTAKSQLLQYVSRIAPRGLYTSGRGSSAAGLTAAVLREKNGGMVLEAGALVLADKGIACLHPNSEVFVDGSPRRIADLFDERRPERVRSGGRELEVCQLRRPVANLELEKLETREVTATLVVRRKYTGELLRVSLDSGMELRLTPDHLVLDGASLKWRPIGQLRPSDRIIALQKLPPCNRPVRILDILPDNWIVQPLPEEKRELRRALKVRHNSLAAINRLYGLKRDALSGRSALAISQFRAILKDIGYYDEWSQRPFAYGRKRQTERLRIAILTPELGYILGFAFGDGYVKSSTRRSQFRITQASVHADYIRRLHDTMEKVSSRPWAVFIRPARGSFVGSVTTESQILCRDSNLLTYLFKWLTRNGLENLLRLDDASLAGFFAGAVDADGCLRVVNYAIDGRPYQKPAFDLLLSNDLRSNRRLLWALRRFDVYARIRPREGVMDIEITSRADVERLTEWIRPFSGKARDFPQPRWRGSGRHEAVPLKPLQSILSGLRPSPSHLLRMGTWSTFHSYRNGKRQPFKASLQRLVNSLGPWMDTNNRSRLVALAGEDYAVDTIREIESEPYNGYVYDLRVPEGEHFVTEGVLTHNCIDEIDKMLPVDRVAIHEAMEQQTVSVAKGGIVATLNARTSVLAAGNPKLGRYDAFLNVGENINLDVTILSRFDLIFLLRDEANSERDARMAEHILTLHKSHIYPEAAPFPPEFLRKYISYAKRILPTLTPEAMKELQDFYLKMRAKGGTKQVAVAITPRQLEALVRLSEARARAFLHDHVSVEDAKSAIRLVNVSMGDVGVDVTTGATDIDVIMTGIPRSFRDNMQKIIEVVMELSRESGSVEEATLLQVLKERENVKEGEAIRLIGQLIKDGILYMPKPGRLKRATG